MKKFLKKVFFWDDSASGAVFGGILFFLSSFCFINLGLLNRFFFEASKGDKIFFSPVVIIMVIIQSLLVAYCLFLFTVFFFRQDHSKFKSFFWYITAAIAIVVNYLITRLDNKLLLFIIGTSLIFAGYNILCVRKRNFGWYISLIVCWIACWPGVLVLFDASRCFDCHSDKLFFPIAVAWRIPIAYSVVFFYIAFMLSNFNLWASANNKRLRDVWGMGCNVLLIMLIISYLSIVAAALCQKKKCQKALIALEKNFLRKISADAVKEIYYHARKTDENFHIALNKSWNDFNRQDKLLNQIISEPAQLDKLPEQCRNKFFSIEAEKIGKFFDVPLPARQRDYSAGKLMSMMLPELQIMREIARLFAWQIRIACENQDYPKAMQAWKRSANIKEYFEHDTTLIAILIMFAIEDICLDSLEQLLASNMLSDDDLKDIQMFLCNYAKRIPKIKRNVLYFEAVLGNDFVCELVNSSKNKDNENAGAEGIKHYRFLAPGLWYLANRNYCNLLLRYNVESIDKFDGKIDYSPENYLINMLMPAFKNVADRIMTLEMRYQAFNALIEAEKIKRKTGKYPQTLSFNIIDHFSGKPLLYKVGEHKKRESYIKKEKHPNGAMEQGYYYNVAERIKTVYGVAVQSDGRNKTNDDGIYGTLDKYGKRTDDPRALLIISQ